MKRLIQNLINWFYTTWLGNLYFDYLLWKDRQDDRKSLRYLSPKEVQQIIRQYSLMSEGVREVKRKVNDLVKSKTVEEYHQTLGQIENMIKLAERDPDSPQAKFAEALRSFGDLNKVKDIETVTDRARMVDKRIKDYKELHSHIEKRQLLRNIRKAKSEGNKELVTKLEQEFYEQYGKRDLKS